MTLAVLYLVLIVGCAVPSFFSSSTSSSSPSSISPPPSPASSTSSSSPSFISPPPSLAPCYELDGYRDAAAGGPHYKPLNPYVIREVRYEPREDYDYDETGIASWYGPGFHGKQTANGETYDQMALTAAHKTLPLPSCVRVTNLENGLSIVLRVNDRGPFYPGRIIDVSQRAAQILGFQRQGTTRIRVQILGDISLTMRDYITG